MPKKDRSPFKAGLFIVITFVLIGAVIVGIKGIRTVFTPVRDCRAIFSLSDDIGGLRVGDDVRLGGYKVGVIRKIEVQGVDDGQKPAILIAFTLPTKFPLHENAHIAVQTGLTGSSCLNIDSLGNGPLLAEDSQLSGSPDSFSALKGSLAEAGPQITGLLSEVRPQITAVLGKAGLAIDRGGEAFAKVRDLFGDTNTDIRGTMANLNAVTGSAKTKLPSILDHADSALVKVGDTIDSTKTAIEDLKTSLANAKELTASARGVLVGNRGKLDGIIAALKNTSDNLKGASVEIRRSPWRLLYKPAPGEVDNLTLFDAARQFAEGANNMNDAALALRDAAHDPGVDHDQLQKLVEKLNTAFGSFSVVGQKLWTAVKE